MLPRALAQILEHQVHQESDLEVWDHSKSKRRHATQASDSILMNTFYMWLYGVFSVYGMSNTLCSSTQHMLHVLAAEEG